MRSLFPTAVVVVVVAAVFLGFLDGQQQQQHQGSQQQSQFSWMWYDHFDEVDDHMRTVDADNCHAKAREELVLRPDTVAQLPVYNQLLNRIWYRNRTSLIHLHNMALNRAFFYSYILQKMNGTRSFHVQPNWLYMYMSATADVNANPYMINGSAFYFDQHCHYPNWYDTVPFNKTLPLFGPKAWRHDDYTDQDNLLREPTRRVVEVEDLGAGRGNNYTHSGYKMNPWFTKWLPDLTGDLDSLMKFTYYVGVKYSNETGRFTKDEFEGFPFFGPSSPSAQETDPRLLPVMFTQPYFDCGRSNKWIVSAVSPVVDFMPRYSNWTHLRRQRYVGVVVTDTDFIELDFNACGVSPGNPGPSYLSGVHRCQKTTGCKHKIGYGFKRGGYICHCKNGYTYPWNLKLPYQGDFIEQSTDIEYKAGFKCTPVDHRLVLPIVDNLEGVSILGGSTLVNSGGVRLNAESDDSSGNSSAVVGGGGGSNSFLVNPSFRVRSLQSVRYRNDTNGVLQPRQRGHLKKNQVSAEISPGVGRTYGPRTQQHAEDNTDLLWEPTRSKTHVPYGMHADTVAVHDRKRVTAAQIEAAAQRRQAMIAARKKDKRKGENFNETEEIRTKRRRRASVFDHQAFDRMMRVMRHKESVTGENCHRLAPDQLLLAGDVAYGVEKQFEPEGRTALRLSHFLCNFLQNTAPTENFGNLKGGGLLHEEHLIGEVLANVMGNFRIYSSGVYFDRYQFQNQDETRRELFGPWAYKKQGAMYVVDTAGMPASYTDQPWFRTAKQRWTTNLKGLRTYKMRSYVRSDPNGTSSVRHEHFPLQYKAPAYSAGHWTRPHFHCDGNVDAWVITYVTPFFGLDSLRRKLEFKGVVTVDVPLNLLELNQCPQGFGVANAFKNTARCDYFSTWCRPQMGFPFMRGAYRCDCRRGFEYHHLDGKFWIEGSLVELEYEKKARGLFSRFDELKCRIAAASTMTATLPALLLALLLARAASEP